MKYYTLLDKRDKDFRFYGSVREIAIELLMFDAVDIYEVDDNLKRYNHGQDGYYIYELNRDIA